MTNSPGLLDELMAKLNVMPRDQLVALEQEVARSTGAMKWVPNPGPQTDCYLSEADEILFGGQGGGGKTSLLCGLALTAHTRSALVRRSYSDIGGLMDEAISINGTKNGFNGSPPPRLRTADGRIVDFWACNQLGDEQKHQGKPHDFLGYDEVTHFEEIQFRFLNGWLRTATPGQRTRIVAASNPPFGNQGMWVIAYWAPWLDPTYPNPAQPGELRWVITDDNSRDFWVDGPGDYELASGTIVGAKSRTFIPSRLADNPFLVNTDYQRQLDALPEPYRSAVRDGNFMAARKDVDNALFPLAWIHAAQKRWRDRRDLNGGRELPPAGVPMCSIAMDPTGGGKDECTVVGRYDGWFPSIKAKPARDVPKGADMAGFLLSERRDECDIIMDMGGGYGGAPMEVLEENIDKAKLHSYRGSDATVRRSKKERLGYLNKRTQSMWELREALDPEQPGGSTIELPDDPVLTSQMSVHTFKITKNGIEVLSKEKVKQALGGKSPDRIDVVVMCWSEGMRAATHAAIWQNQKAATDFRNGVSSARPVQAMAKMAYSNRRR